MSNPSIPRNVPSAMADRLIVALDVPTIAEAERLIAALDGTVSFFKIGLWLAFAEGVDGLIGGLVRAGKRVFLDAKMYDIGKTVEEGVARAADRGVSLVTVHGDRQIMESAVKGKRGSDLMIFAITVGGATMWSMPPASSTRVTFARSTPSPCWAAASSICGG